MSRAFIISFLCSLGLACTDEPAGFTGTGFTAAARLADVNAYVESNVHGGRLFRISTSAIDLSGSAPEWSYCFLDTSGSLHYVHATSTDVVYDSTGPLLPGPGVITLNWFDSDSAVMFAELNGGSAYRAEHADCRMSARLSQVWTPDPHASWWIFYSSNSSISLGLQIDAVTGAKVGQTR